MYGARILVVDENDFDREQIAAWLRDEGFEVTSCTGPCAPSYACPGGRGEPCALAVPVDVIVLDAWLESDTVMEGVPGWQLIPYYLGLGKPVVLIGGPEDAVESYLDDHVALVHRPAEREVLLAAVHAQFGRVRPARVPPNVESADAPTVTPPLPNDLVPFDAANS